MVFIREQIIYHLFMMNLQARDPIFFDQPAIYQIVVQGRIDLASPDNLEGMTTHQFMEEVEPPSHNFGGRVE